MILLRTCQLQKAINLTFTTYHCCDSHNDQHNMRLGFSLLFFGDMAYIGPGSLISRMVCRAPCLTIATFSRNWFQFGPTPIINFVDFLSPAVASPWHMSNSLTIHSNILLPLLNNPRLQYSYLVHRPILCSRFHQPHPLHNPQPTLHPTKDRMLPIQPRRRRKCNTVTPLVPRTL